MQAPLNTSAGCLIRAIKPLLVASSGSRPSFTVSAPSHSLPLRQPPLQPPPSCSVPVRVPAAVVATRIIAIIVASLNRYRTPLAPQTNTRDASRRPSRSCGFKDDRTSLRPAIQKWKRWSPGVGSIGFLRFHENLEVNTLTTTKIFRVLCGDSR